MINQLAIIGAGPAGIMAAIQAAKRGKKVLLLDRSGSMGNKLLIAGGGRCNLTNTRPLDESLGCYHNGVFLRNAFARFFSDNLISFFEENGLKLVLERGQRVFPESQSAEDVVGLLRSMLEKNKVQLWLRNRVIKMEKGEGVFELVCQKGEISAEKVVIATGGKSYPETGSTGDGYNLARRLGHTILKPLPALCGIDLKEQWIRKWQGVSLENVNVRIEQKGTNLGEEFGEVLFTHFGISGPAILNLSRVLTDIRQKEGISLVIDFKPALDNKTLDNRLVREFKNAPSKVLRNILKELLPQGIIDDFIRTGNLPGNKMANQITAAERGRILEVLKNFRLIPENLRPIEEAIVTRGGVNVKEINPKTMESKIVPGLYFAGEVIDVDGKTGGFNLQAAFSTGFAAGNNV